MLLINIDNKIKSFYLLNWGDINIYLDWSSYFCLCILISVAPQ